MTTGANWSRNRDAQRGKRVPALWIRRLQPQVGRKRVQLRIALDAQLAHRVDLLRADGLLLAVQACGDLGDAQAFQEQPNHFHFLRRQRRDPALLLATQQLHHRRRVIAAMRVDRHHRRLHLRKIIGLADNASGAATGIELVDQAGLVQASHHHHAQCREVVRKIAQQLQAITKGTAGHRIVGHHHVAGLALKQGDQFSGVSHRADALDRRGFIQSTC